MTRVNLKTGILRPDVIYWLDNNVGKGEWVLYADNTIVFTRSEDATLFTLTYYKKLKEGTLGVAWAVTYKYNDALILAARRQQALDKVHKVHLRVLIYLQNTFQEGRDYAWGEMGKKTLVNEYLYFASEEDLVAFRLATGV